MRWPQRSATDARRKPLRKRPALRVARASSGRARVTATATEPADVASTVAIVVAVAIILSEAKAEIAPETFGGTNDAPRWSATQRQRVTGVSQRAYRRIPSLAGRARLDVPIGSAAVGRAVAPTGIWLRACGPRSVRARDSLREKTFGQSSAILNIDSGIQRGARPDPTPAQPENENE
jgi:hypothetical protein